MKAEAASQTALQDGNGVKAETKLGAAAFHAVSTQHCGETRSFTISTRVLNHRARGELSVIGRMTLDRLLSNSRKRVSLCKHRGRRVRTSFGLFYLHEKDVCKKELKCNFITNSFKNDQN